MSRAFFSTTCLALSLSATVLCARAAGVVEVSYVQPEQFSDVGRSIIDRERTLKSMTEYFQALGRRLPDGQTLRLEVLDIDLAGTLEPYGFGDLRVLRGRADWPRMTLRYTLQSDGRTIKAGQAQLSDMNYRFDLRGYELRQGELGYEKRMVLQWFDQNFAAPH